MPAFQYNSDNQKRFTPTANEPFMQNVPKEKIFVPTSGVQHRIRILPPWSALGLFARFANTHWRLGAQGNDSFPCPDIWEEGSCPFCKTWAQLRQNYDYYQADVLAIRPTPRYYSNIINVAEPAKGVQLYTYGKRVYAMIKGIQDSGSFGDITDAINGVDLVLQRTGTGMMIQDIVYPTPQHQPIQNPDWLDQLFNLDTLFTKPNQEKIETAYRTQPWRVYNPAAGIVASTSQGQGAYVVQPSAPLGVLQPALQPFVMPPSTGGMVPPSTIGLVPPSTIGLVPPSAGAIGAGTAVTPQQVAAPVTQPGVVAAPQVSDVMANVQSLEDKLRAKLNAAK